MNCIIIHGCPDREEEAVSLADRSFHWVPWVREKLAVQGIKAETPMMPSPWAPNYEKFKAEFEKYEVTEDTILVGHSCGCAFLVRWLGETKQKIARLVLVVPWKIPNKERSGADVDFYTYEIDKTIKDRVQKIIMFTADNEEADGKKSLEIFYHALDGKVIELKNHGHYAMSDMGTIEFPELLEFILK